LPTHARAECGLVLAVPLPVPFLIRGPGIAAGSQFEGLASNVDVMPTLLDLAGGSALQPSQWDGRSAAPLLLGQTELSTRSWRTDLLIEYFAGGEVVRYQHLEDAPNNSFRLLRRLDPTAGAATNLSFAQFVGPENWDFGSPVAAAETELFDLSADPYQLQNTFEAAPTTLREELVAAVGRLFKCAGRSCN
jgi:N-acetylglucosamine-6-sulfatase